MSVFLRYLLFQLPSWALVTVLLVALALSDVLPLWLALAVPAALIVKDLVVFPRVRIAYEPSVEHGGGDLLGALARVDTPLCPEGYVRVGPERWQARLIEPADRVAIGDVVRVRAIDHLTLVVEPEASDAGDHRGADHV